MTIYGALLRAVKVGGPDNLSIAAPKSMCTDAG